MKAQYQRIYYEIAEKIKDGTYPPGMRLPVEPVMAQQFGVSVGTLRKAIDRLVLERKIKRVQGNGTFVAETVVPTTFYTPTAKNTEFIYGCCQRLGDQEQVNEILLRDERESRYIILPSPLDIKPVLSSLYNQCSIIQAPLSAFNEMSDFFRPLPEELFEDIPEPVVKQCRSVDGKLRVYPIILNQTLCYINRRNADRYGIKMPDDNWTLHDMKQLCLQFKEADPNVTPFGILPMMSLWFDVLLWCCGGDFFDKRGNVWLPEEPFRKAMTYNQDLIKSGLAVSITKTDCSSIQEFLCKPYVQMSFYGPRGCMDSEPGVMEMRPLPDGVGSGVIFAIGIPCNSPMPDRALHFIEKLKDHRLSEIKSAAPAAKKDIALWCKNQHVLRPELFMQFAEKQHFVSANPHFYRLLTPINNMFHYSLEGTLPIESIYRDITNILRESMKIGVADHFWT